VEKLFRFDHVKYVSTDQALLYYINQNDN